MRFQFLPVSILIILILFIFFEKWFLMEYLINVNFKKILFLINKKHKDNILRWLIFI